MVKQTALQIQDQKGVTAIDDYHKLADVRIPDDDEGKAQLMEQTLQNLERTHILVSWFLGRIAYNWCEARDKDSEEQDKEKDKKSSTTVDQSMDQLADKLSQGKSTVYNYYMFYKRYPLEGVEKLGRYGVTWLQIRNYTLNKDKKIGQEMFDWFISYVDEKGEKPSPAEAEEKFKELVKSPVKGNTGENKTTTTNLGPEEPEQEDLDLSSFQKFVDNLELTAKNLENAATNYSDGSEPYSQFIQDLYTHQYTGDKLEKRNELTSSAVSQITRCMQIMTDLAAQTAAYSATAKDQLCQDAYELLERFSSNGIHMYLDGNDKPYFNTEDKKES